MSSSQGPPHPLAARQTPAVETPSLPPSTAVGAVAPAPSSAIPAAPAVTDTHRDVWMDVEAPAGIVALHRSIARHVAAVTGFLLVTSALAHTGAIPWLQPVQRVYTRLRDIDIHAGVPDRDAFDSSGVLVQEGAGALQNAAFLLFVGLQVMVVSHGHNTSSKPASSEFRPAAFTSHVAEPAGGRHGCSDSVSRLLGTTVMPLSSRVRMILGLIATFVVAERILLASHVAPMIFVEPAAAPTNSSLAAGTEAIASGEVTWNQPLASLSGMVALAAMDCFTAEMLLLLVHDLGTPLRPTVVVSMRVLAYSCYSAVTLARFITSAVLGFALLAVVFVSGMALVSALLHHQRNLARRPMSSLADPLRTALPRTRQAGSAELDMETDAVTVAALRHDIVTEQVAATRRLRSTAKMGFVLWVLVLILHMALRVMDRALLGISLIHLIDGAVFVIKGALLPTALLLACWAIHHRMLLHVLEHRRVAVEHHQWSRERQLLRYLCHELRTPLNTLSFVTEELQDSARNAPALTIQPRPAQRQDLHVSVVDGGGAAAKVTCKLGQTSQSSARQRGDGSPVADPLQSSAAAATGAVASIQHALDNILLLESVRRHAVPTQQPFVVGELLRAAVRTFELQPISVVIEWMGLGETTPASTVSVGGEGARCRAGSGSAATVNGGSHPSIVTAATDRRLSGSGSSEEVVAHGDVEAIRHTLWVFLSNALRFGAAATDSVPQVTVRAKIFRELPLAGHDGQAIVIGTPPSFEQSADLGRNSPVHSGAATPALMVQVKDSGQGIAREDLPKLFREFQMIGSSARSKGNSTGLGLAVAKQLVLRNDGIIGAWSEGVGQGAVFWFIIPLRMPGTGPSISRRGNRSPANAFGSVGSSISLSLTAEARSSSQQLHVSPSASSIVSPQSLRGSSRLLEGGGQSAASNKWGATAPGSPRAAAAALRPQGLLGVHTRPPYDSHGLGSPAQPASASSWTTTQLQGAEQLSFQFSSPERRGDKVEVPTTRTLSSNSTTDQQLPPDSLQASPLRVGMLERYPAAQVARSHQGTHPVCAGPQTRLPSHHMLPPRIPLLPKAPPDTRQPPPPAPARLTGRVEFVETCSAHSQRPEEDSAMPRKSARNPIIPKDDVVRDRSTTNTESVGEQGVEWASETALCCRSRSHAHHRTAGNADAEHTRACDPGGGGAAVGAEELVDNSAIKPARLDQAAASAQDALAPPAELAWLTAAMVVDDVQSNRRLLVRSLLQMGVRTVLSAEDGFDALRKLDAYSASDVACKVTDTHVSPARDASPQFAQLHLTMPVVLTDQEMPVCDGIGLTMRLREGGYRGLIVAVTGNAHEDDIRRLLEVGADQVVLKPVRRQHLVACLRDLSTANARGEGLHTARTSPG